MLLLLYSNANATSTANPKEKKTWKFVQCNWTTTFVMWLASLKFLDEKTIKLVLEYVQEAGVTNDIKVCWLYLTLGTSEVLVNSAN
eukprot:COSAG05_NODE_3349_length_2133_cov_6.365591_2_plen_86_part_00